MVHAQDTGEESQPDDSNYDRLDGVGASGATVNVIEWEGNLEIHVAPPGALHGLSLKLDTRNKSKPVMGDRLSPRVRFQGFCSFAARS